MSETLHPEEPVTSFFLVRHGKTDAVERGILHADPQTPLTERGLQQAAEMATWLTCANADVLLSSQAQRVIKTADVIAEQIKHKPIIITDLDEWHVGLWEGKTYLDIKKTEAELYNQWLADPIANKAPGGESIADLYNRVVESLKVLIKQYAGKQVILVTHAGVIRSILVHALGMPITNFWRLNVPTASIAKVDFSENFALVHYTAFVPGQSK